MTAFSYYTTLTLVATSVSSYITSYIQTTSVVTVGLVLKIWSDSCQACRTYSAAPVQYVVGMPSVHYIIILYLLFMCTVKFIINNNYMHIF